jgi:steroid delta-isomerase-like uncharacterized protein
MSTVETARNKEAFKHFADTINTGDVARISRMIDEVTKADALIRTPVPLDVTGAEALKRVWTTLFRAFPDLHVTVEDVIAEGDKLVCRNTVTGTHRGEYMGISPTGKSISYDEIFIFRFENGRIAETWGVVDVLSQMRQLGLIAG